MRALFAAVVPWATLVFAVSSMLAVGLAHSVREVLWPLRRWKRVLGALSINFGLAPLLAYLLARLFRLDFPHALGLFVVGSAAGAPFLLKLTQFARGNVAFAASLLVVLLPCTIAFLPLVVPIAAPRAEVSAGAIAVPLVFSMLLPLALGLSVRPVAPRFSARAAHILSRFATFALGVLLLSIVVVNWGAIVGIGARPILAAAVFTLVAFGLGWWLGAPYPYIQEVLALGAALRNIAAATVVATQTFEHLSGVLVMVTATSVVALVLLFPISFAVRRGAEARFLRRRHA